LEKSHPVLRINDQLAVIRPYFHGNSFLTLSVKQAEILGMLLAKIHGLKLQSHGLEHLPEIRWPVDIKYPVWLLDIVAQCNESIRYRADLWVCSHRDMHRGNILWQDKNTPHLIDWESAGLINPGVELAGLASNCAGVAVCQFDEHLFLATLRGYKAVALQLPTMDKIMWVQTWHSWLLWYAFLNLDGQKVDRENTMDILNFMQGVQMKIQQLYCSYP